MKMFLFCTIQSVQHGIMGRYESWILGHFSALEASGFQILEESWELEFNCKKAAVHNCQHKGISI